MNERILSGEQFLKTILDAYPAAVLIVDRDLRIYDANRVACEFIEEKSDLNLRRLCGDLLHCMYDRDSDGGCGTTDHCPDCVVRNMVTSVVDGGTVFRRIAPMKLEQKKKIQDVWFLVTCAPLAYKEMELVIVTLEDVTELAELRRILPICSHCRKVRDDNDYWHGVQEYLEKHTGAQFSHGICPDCLQEHYSELDGDRAEDEAGDEEVLQE